MPSNAWTLALVPALVPVVGRDVSARQLDRPHAREEVGVEEEREREPVARRRVADAVRRRAEQRRAVMRSSMSPMLQTNEPGTGGAATHRDRDFTSRPPASSCNRIVSRP